jgi:hypothetical protein
VVSDSFDLTAHPTGDRTVISSPESGLVFYTRNGGGAASIVDDATSGSKALQFADDANNAGTSGQVVASLPSTLSIANVNDSVSLSFTVRFVNQGDGNSSNFPLRVLFVKQHRSIRGQHGLR